MEVPKVIQLVNGKVRIHIQVAQTPQPTGPLYPTSHLLAHGSSHCSTLEKKELKLKQIK